MEALLFSYNWNNKLFNQCLTTLRLKSEKYAIGKEVRVMLSQGTRAVPLVLGVAKIVDIREFSLKNLTDGVSRVDTGYPAEDWTGPDGKPQKGGKSIIRKMYPQITYWDRQPIYLIFLEFTERVEYPPLPKIKAAPVAVESLLPSFTSSRMDA